MCHDTHSKGLSEGQSKEFSSKAFGIMQLMRRTHPRQPNRGFVNQDRNNLSQKARANGLMG